MVEHRTFTSLWLACWLLALDKSKTSGNREVQEVRAIYEERLKVVDPLEVRAIGARLGRLVILLVPGWPGLRRLSVCWLLPCFG